MTAGIGADGGRSKLEASVVDTDGRTPPDIGKRALPGASAGGGLERMMEIRRLRAECVAQRPGYDEPPTPVLERSSVVVDPTVLSGSRKRLRRCPSCHSNARNRAAVLGLTTSIPALPLGHHLFLQVTRGVLPAQV